jgi:hypothetical protein
MANQQTYQYSPTDPPERVTSEPVPVPPHTDEERDQADLVDSDRVDADRDESVEDVTDRVPEDTLDDRGTFEDPALAGERNDPDDLTAVTPGTPEFHEPAPQQTAFGAATVGGAAAAAAQAGPSREVRDRSDADEEGTVDVRDPYDDADLEADRRPDHNGHDVREDLDTADSGSDHTDYIDADVDADREVDEPAGSPSDLYEATPDETVVTQPIAGLWGEGTAQGYRDRWREVQLRFVDDPPAAAREANQLVEEAVGALTAELSKQKESLRDWSGEDTEELRAVVRRHRDFLDRLLGL